MIGPADRLILDADAMERNLIKRRVRGLIEARGAIVGALVAVVFMVAFQPQTHRWTFVGLVALAAFMGACIDAEANRI